MKLRRARIAYRVMKGAGCAAGFVVSCAAASAASVGESPGVASFESGVQSTFEGSDAGLGADVAGLQDPLRIGPAFPMWQAVLTPAEFARLSRIGPMTVISASATSGDPAPVSFSGALSRGPVADYGFHIRERHGGWLDGRGDGNGRGDGHCEFGDCRSGAPVPEPGTFVLALSGAAALWLLLRRRLRARRMAAPPLA